MSPVEREDDSVRVPESLSVLPLRDVVIFPGMITPLLVGRPRSLAALDEAMKGERLLLVLTQRQMNVDDPAPEDLYQVGTVVKILQLMRLVEGTIRILVEGVARGEVQRFHKTRKYLRADVRALSGASLASNQMEAMVRSVSSQFTEYVQLNKRIPDEVLRSVLPIEDPDRLADSIASHLIAKIDSKQPLLEAVDLPVRYRQLGTILAEELEILRLEKKIEGEVRSQVQKNQKEFYLNEQLKAIRKELGHGGGDETSEVDEVRERIENAGMPERAK
jgi:ATP-dependent Lon protease